MDFFFVGVWEVKYKTKLRYSEILWSLYTDSGNLYELYQKEMYYHRVELVLVKIKNICHF